MKKFLAILVAAMMLCAAASVMAEEATIKYWFWADNDAYAQTMQDMIADFNATNGKGITVVGEQYPVGWRRIQQQPADRGDRRRRPRRGQLQADGYPLLRRQRPA